MTDAISAPLQRFLPFLRRSLHVIRRCWQFSCRPLFACPRSAVRAGRWLISLFLIYLLLTVALLPPVVRWGWPQLAERLWQQPASVGTVLFNPFDGSLRLTDLRLGDSEQPPLQFDLLHLQPAWWASLLQQRWTVDQLQIDGLRAEVQRLADNRIDIDWLWASSSDEPPAPTSAPPALLIRALPLNAELLLWRDLTATPTVELALTPVTLRLQNLSTVAGVQGQLQLQLARTGGGRVQLDSQLELFPTFTTAGQLQFSGLPLAAAWGYAAPFLELLPPQGQLAGSSAFTLKDGEALQLQLSELSLAVEDLALTAPTQPEPLLQLQQLRLDDSQLDLQQRQLQLGKLLIADGQIRADFAADGNSPWLTLVKTPTDESAAETANVEVATVEPVEITETADNTTATEPVASVESSDPAPQWQVQLSAGHLQRLAMQFSDQRMRQPLALNIAAIDAEIAAEWGNKQQIQVKNLALHDNQLGPKGKAAQITLAELALDSAALDLLSQQLQLGQLTLTRLSSELLRDKKSQWPLLDLFEPQIAAKPEPKKAEAAADKPWQLELKKLALVDADIGVKDESISPAMTYQWRQLQLQLEPLRWPLTGTSSFNLTSGRASAGEWQLHGPIDLAKQKGEFGYRIEGFDLRPLQHYLSQAIQLKLAEGKLYSNGKFQFDASKTPLSTQVSGTASISNVRLQETIDQEQLLGWRQLRADGIVLNGEPFNLKIASLKLRKPEAKVVIFNDSTTNLGRLAAAPSGKETTTAATPAPAATPADPIVQVERMEVTDGAVDFADFSLILPFSTRIHEFNGVITGISSATEARSSLQLEGQVAEYGEARVSGELAPAAAKQFSNVLVNFRNVALSPLSPYTATFAGHTIAAGRVNLDLQYRVDDGKLNSENAIMLRGLKLGEVVDEAAAGNLPLNFILALLTDSEGKIDLTLPISGDVNSPEFNYSRVAGQALKTLLVNIATSPFTALSKLFGNGSDLPEQVGFLPGRSAVSGSQREQILILTDALLAKPELRLKVLGAVDPKLDQQVLQLVGLRSAIAHYQDVDLGDIERFTPIPLTDGSTQYALEQLLIQAQGEAALAEIKATFNKAQGRAPEPVGLIASELGRASVDTDYYRLISERLLALQQVSTADLQQLAAARANAVKTVMTTAGLPAAQVVVGEQFEQKTAVSGGDAQDLLINLDLKLELLSN